MKICLFDIDGTLVKTGGAGKSAFDEALRTAFDLIDACEGIAFSGRTDRAILRDIFELNQVENTPHTWQRFKLAYLSLLPDCLAKHEGTILPGIAELLERICGRHDVSIGLLTGNIAEGARLKLAHYDLFQHFPFGGYGDDHLDRDDVAHEALLKAGEHTGRDPDPADVWVIGDTPLDVGCARAIGANVVAVQTGWCSKEDLQAAQPDLLLDDLSDPDPVLDAIFSR